MKKTIYLSLFSALCLMSCATGKTWEFDTDYFRIGINDKGYITSMKNTTVYPQREFSPTDKPSPLMSLYNSDKNTYYYPVKARYDAAVGNIVLDYTNGSIATISIRPEKKYFKLKLENIEPRDDIDGIQWGDYHTNITNLLGEIIGVARDTSDAVNYSIGMLALDDNTLGGTSDIAGDAAPFSIYHSHA